MTHGSPPPSVRPPWAPYLDLEQVGVHPESSSREVKAASFDLMKVGMTPELRASWDVLRAPTRRLAVDFFLLDGDLLATGANRAR